jgi:hypothetical protein
MWLRAAATQLSARAIARQLGCAPDTVRAAFRAAEIKPAATNRSRRPAELDDPDWLAMKYRTCSAATIAAELGCAPATVNRALHRHQVVVRDRSAGQQFRSPAPLDDPVWLADRYAAGASTSTIAEELGIPAITVNKALHRHDIALDRPWVRRDTTRLERPPDRQLASVWDEHHTIRAVAQQFSVAHTTAAIWLARADIFVNDIPALSRSQLEAAITDGLPLRQIAARHHVSQHIVTVELIRHDLLEQHRHRPS